MFVQRSFCFIAYLVSFSYSEVLRLPCRRHGNFSLRHKGKQMTEVTVLDTLSIPTVADCVTRCVGHDTCQHVNYHNDVKSCELLEEGEGTLVNKTNSEYLTTETDEQNFGPFCKSIAPCVPVRQECHDTCDGVGYRCAKNSGLLETNKLFKTVSLLSKQWFLSVDIKPLGSEDVHKSIVHATIGNDYGTYGDRNPGIWLFGSSLFVAAAINGDINYSFYSTPIVMNVYINLRVEQKLEGDQYLYRIYIDGAKVHEVVNNAPSTFSNIKVYAANPWAYTADAIIKNLKYDNI